MAVAIHQALDDIEVERVKLLDVLRKAGYDPYNVADVTTSIKGDALMIEVSVGVQINYAIKRTANGIELTRVDMLGKPIGGA